MEMATTATVDALVPTRADASESRPIMLMLLSSDDGDAFSGDSGSEDDAATIMGSPLAQPDPVTPPGQLEAPLLAEDPSLGSAQAVANSPLREARSAPQKRIEDVFAARPRQLQEEIAADVDDEDDTFDSSPPASQQSDVILSPSSQLHILSQISEMASLRAAREREATATAATTVVRAARLAHAWAPVAQRAQARQENTQQPPQTTAPKKKTKKRKTPSEPPATVKLPRSTKAMAPALVADIATWEAFDEPILAGDDGAEDDWSFEDISDSDFD